MVLPLNLKMFALHTALPKPVWREIHGNYVLYDNRIVTKWGTPISVQDAEEFISNHQLNDYLPSIEQEEQPSRIIWRDRNSFHVLHENGRVSINGQLLTPPQAELFKLEHNLHEVSNINNYYKAIDTEDQEWKHLHAQLTKLRETNKWSIEELCHC